MILLHPYISDSGNLATKLKVTDGTILANSVCSKTDDPNNGGYYWGSNINAGHICIDRIDTGACNVCILMIIREVNNKTNESFSWFPTWSTKKSHTHVYKPIVDD